MTPLELSRHPALWRPVFGKRRIVWALQPKRFERSTIAPGVTLYSAGAGAGTLIVGFCGRQSRLFLPMAVFLQALDDTRYDLLVVSDARHLHFDSGVEGYSASLPELCAKIAALAEARGYGALITYGISMGGLPALRAGDLLGADRAIAAGGRFPWHVGRLVRKDQQIGAFDLLCECRVQRATGRYALFSERHPDDADSAARLARISVTCRTIGMPSDNHNFPYLIHRRRKLESFHRQMFDLNVEPDPARLRALLA